MNSVTDTIKNKIKEFVTLNLPKDFKTVYWSAQKFEMPKKPFCLLSWVSDSEDLRSSERQLPNSLTKEHREYKTGTITIALYVDGLKTKGHNLEEREKLAQNSLENLRTQFQLLKTTNLFRKVCAINNTSGIRPLDEAVSGGYIYRREFDLTIGYDIVYHYDLPVSHAVNIDLDENDIHIQVTEDEIK